MAELNDKQSLTLIVAAKDALRDAQHSRTWEQRVAAIARIECGEQNSEGRVSARGFKVIAATR